MELEKVHTIIENEWQDHLEKVRNFCRQKSISQTGEGVMETAHLCLKEIEACGGSGEVVETKGNPIVYGELNTGAKNTLLIYGMYDVQPADAKDWSVPPFGGEIKDLPGFGPCMVVRGAVNTKGPLQGVFNVIKLLTKNNELPVNLIFVIEGEEEQGSVSLPQFIADYKEKLKVADAMVFPFYTQDPDGVPICNLGVRGLLMLEVISRGGDYGGPRSRDIHSGQSTIIKSPVWRLVHALSKLVDENDELLLPELDADFFELDEDDKRLLADLENKIRLEVFLEKNDVRRFIWDNPSVSTIVKSLCFRPTCNINGIWSGYTGPIGMTVLPNKATARLDIRLVPGMEGSKVVEALKNYLAKKGYDDGIELKVIRMTPASKVSPRESIVQAVLETYKYHQVDPAVWPLFHGAAPFYLFSEELKMPWVMVGLGHGGRQHTSDEYATVKGMKDFEKSLATFFYQYQQLKEGE